MRRDIPVSYGLNTDFKQLRKLMAAFDDLPDDAPAMVMLRQIPGSEVAGDHDHLMCLWGGDRGAVWLDETD
jgi:hypothetical protein